MNTGKKALRKKYLSLPQKKLGSTVSNDEYKGRAYKKPCKNP